MSQLLAARAQMGMSLAFHIIFSVLGVGLPLLLCIVEGLALKTGDAEWMRLTKRWSRAVAILFAIGAVSGTILSFELGLLWPIYTRYAGSVVGLPFMLEGFAFFLEAIFLGLYLYGWQRLSPLAHWLCSFPIWISGLASAWFIVSTNSWMNTPSGFEMNSAGQITNIDPIAAMFNPSTPYQTTHMIFACYVCTGFAVAAVYAWSMLRGKNDGYNRKALTVAMAMALIATPLQIISGDLTARFVGNVQPAKFAAMEALYKSQRNPPITVGGIPNDETQTTLLAIEIPGGLSLLLDSPDAVVKGLDQYPREDWPPVLMVHLAFDGMVGSGFFVLFIALIFWFLWWRKKHAVPNNRWLNLGIVISGFLSFVALELGWMVTEMGRQPWVIVGVLRTKDAVTTAPLLNISFLIFTLIYLLLAVGLIYLLLKVVPAPLRDGSESKPETGGV
jgi:cytochrome d ubiquinol oxidase subunit I